jgi:hypothetical protein
MSELAPGLASEHKRGRGHGRVCRCDDYGCVGDGIRVSIAQVGHIGGLASGGCICFPKAERSRGFSG